MKIPVLDYAESVRDFEKGGEFFTHAMQDPGFLFLKNIPGYDAAELKKWTLWFFNDLTDAERMELRTDPYRGFVPAKKDAESSYKELYEIGGLDEDRTKEFMLYDKQRWPSKNKEFQKFFRTYYALMSEIAHNLVKMMSVYNGMNNDKFEDMFLPNDFSTLRLIHYPKREGEVPGGLKDGDTVLHCQPHSDNGFVTLLSTFNLPGLEMLDKDGNYVPVEASDDGLFINIGDLMMTLIGHDVKATWHRVVDHGVERYSVPFFFEPHWDAVVKTASRPAMKYGISVLEKCTTFFEHAHLLDQVKRDPRYQNLPEFRAARKLSHAEVNAR